MFVTRGPRARSLGAHFRGTRTLGIISIRCFCIVSFLTFKSQPTNQPFLTYGSVEILVENLTFFIRRTAPVTLVVLNVPAADYKPNSITLASSELASNMFGASSQLVRS